MKSELYTMSQDELDRLEAMHHLQSRILTQCDVARQLRLSVRQVKRLWRRFCIGGAAALRSTRRGRPSNRRLNAEFVAAAVQLVRTHYADFGPTFASEKLLERHDVRIARETLRQAMIADGLWQPSAAPRRTVHPPRARRPCFGELIQIDGSAHAWFEDRGPRCTLIVFVDDATSKLTGLRFVQAESTWSYFVLMDGYLRREGKPLAFYGDRSGIFRKNLASLQGDRHTQFGRAMDALQIQMICANSPQAKGRVERANGVLQDRLVKELRLRGISTLESANAYVEEFRMCYNERFAVQPASMINAHRPLAAEDDLDRILTIQTARKISVNLTLQHRTIVYEILEPHSKHRLQHADAMVCEDRKGKITIEHNGRPLHYRVLHEHSTQGTIASRKELLAIDATISVRKSTAHTPAADHPWRTSFVRRGRKKGHRYPAKGGHDD